MKLIHCRFSSGQRVPTRSVHLHPTQTQAPRLPSAAAHLPAIQAFYTYAQSRDAHLDGVILVCHFESILALNSRGFSRDPRASQLRLLGAEYLKQPH